MTFKEKLQTEHPEMVDKRFGGGVKGCPYHYGYEKNLNCMVWESDEKCEECWNREMQNTDKKTEESLKILEAHNKAYERGLNDAWEFIKKWDNMDYERSCEVFKSTSLRRLLEYSPQEALAKLKAYEEQIKVGDVVTYAGDKGVVLDKRGSKIIVLSDDCWVSEWYECDAEKTGKHIELDGLLEKIGE